MARTLGSQEFDAMCKHRLEGERKFAKDCVLIPESPSAHKDGDSVFLLYSGIDKASGRAFSTDMRPVRDYIFTVYVESMGIAFKDHLSDFAEIVRSVKHN